MSVPDRVERWTDKPRVVEMMPWDGTAECAEAIQRWVGSFEDGDPLFLPGVDENSVSRIAAATRYSGAQVWNTQERCWVSCPVGHRVAKGRLGEFYPISPAALEAGYTRVDGDG